MRMYALDFRGGGAVVAHWRAPGWQMGNEEKWWQCVDLSKVDARSVATMLPNGSQVTR